MTRNNQNRLHRQLIAVTERKGEIYSYIFRARTERKKKLIMNEFFYQIRQRRTRYIHLLNNSVVKSYVNPVIYNSLLNSYIIFLCLEIFCVCHLISKYVKI
jgi:hypothetical protein